MAINLRPQIRRARSGCFESSFSRHRAGPAGGDGPRKAHRSLRKTRLVPLRVASGTKLDLPDADKGSYALVVEPWTPAMGGSRRNVLAPPRQKQSAGNARLLSHDYMDGHAAALDRARPAGARARSRRRCAGRPARAHGGLSSAQGLQNPASPSRTRIPLYDRIQRWGAPSAKPDTVAFISTHPSGCSASSSATPALCGWDCATKAALSVSMIATRACRCRSRSAPAPKTLSLIDGLVAFDRAAAPNLYLVLAATALAFLFVYLPIRGRKRPPAPLPDPPCSRRTRVQSAGPGVPCFGGHP